MKGLKNALVRGVLQTIFPSDSQFCSFPAPWIPPEQMSIEGCSVIAILVSSVTAGLTFRAMEMQDLIKQYETKKDDELLLLALDSEQLTPEATTALNSELAKRRIGTGRLNVFHAEKEHHEAEQRKKPGPLFVVHPYGIGRKRFGKANYEYSSETGMERFKTTVFIVLFWLPLLPTGTYFVERKKEFLSSEITVLERLPLDWEQVLKVWIVMAGSLLCLIWILRLLRP